ncbi:hypothetical protein TSAR_003688 [Trichomalopsis sarcophagae]|uniref:Uncharacterized protein n=1 Tax=Trichomalopsis sarcophagae TaxID=543379 RepID=A0A232F016_9HYME|nr:hypothetical protein TSAR_003688 [Trichomalopsis sarcophagae]
MSIATPDLLNAISDLATIREMKVAVSVTSQCGLITAVTTMIGGLIAGPPGIGIGGLVGTVAACYHSNGKFKSVPEILMTEASPEQKEKLADAVRNVLTAENILTLVQLAATIQNNRMLLDTIQKVVRDFLTSDMGYCIS